MLAGLVPRVSVPRIVHSANALTALSGTAGGQTVASHRLIQAGHGGIDIELGNRIPLAGPTLLGDWSGTLHQLLVELVPLNTVKLPVR